MDNPEVLSLENDWTPAYNPVEFEKSNNSSDYEVEKNKKKKREGKPLLITIQLIISLLLLLSFYALKLFSFDIFSELKKWYDTNLNNEIIITESFNSFSIDNLINELKIK